MIPRMPKLSDLEKLVTTLQQNPFGSLMLLVLVVAVFTGIYALKR